MRISIITPCRNAETFLAETIQSVVGQRGDFEIEYTIVDGGSTDRTVEVVERHARDLESGRIETYCRGVSLDCLSEKDEGMYDALAKGLRRAGGEIVAYINSDDFYLPNAFSTVTDIFSRYADVEWLTGMPVCYNEKGQITDTFLPLGYDGDLIRKGVFGRMVPHIQQESTFWRAGLMRQLDFEELRRHRYAGDFYLWSRFSRSADLHVVQSCLAGYRTRSGQLTGRMDLYEEEFRRIAVPGTVIDAVRGKLLRKLNDVLSNKYKRKIGKRMIQFRNGEWVKHP
ncbi:MAG: glycosyltransferase [Deltaproteobacteria bacterium]|jgi:glycosyltransferase involved in cell wall biosynthesis|nr:MAG: glycosyltransferase [Deltaproteobacteria bacterium]